jgi:hypothetical protein
MLSGILISGILLILSLFGPDGGGAQSSGGLRFVEVTVTGVHDSEPILSLEGSSVTDPGEQFAVDVELYSLPCPGRYHCVAKGEDERFGVSTEFETILKLEGYETAPRGIRCGGALPRTAGSRGGEVVLRGPSDTPFLLDVRPRRRDLSFGALLTLNGVTKCGRAYRFRTTLHNRPGGLEYRYRAAFLRAVSFIGDRSEKVVGCRLLRGHR